MKIPTVLILLFALNIDPGTRITSFNLKTPDKRIQVLGKYLKLKSTLIDAEFDIFDVNLNARYSIPGASDWDYRIALKVDPKNIAVWLNDSKTVSSISEYDWCFDLIKNNPGFLIQSVPVFYQSKEKTVIVYRKEGIIFLRYVSH